MGNLRLQSGTLNDSSDVWKNTYGAGAHGGATFVAVGADAADAAEEILLVFDLQEELKEASSIAFAGIAFEGGDKVTGRQRGRPPFSADDGFRHGDAHLGIVSVGTGWKGVARIFNVGRQVVVLRYPVIRGGLKSGTVGVTDGDFEKHAWKTTWIDW